MDIIDKTSTILMSTLNFFRRRDTMNIAENDLFLESNNSSKIQSAPPIKLYIYGNGMYNELKVNSVSELWPLVEKYKSLGKIWIDVEGRGDLAFIHQIGKYFDLHELEMEDVFNIHQRPKVEYYDHHLFVISRMIYFSQTHKSLINEQVAFFVFDNILLTFQEEHEDAFDGVREKMKKNHSMLCNGNIFFLAWALMDAIIDQYFVILDDLGVRLEKIDNQLLHNPQKSNLLEIQSMKREVMFLRKAILAERDKFAEIERHDFELIDAKTRIYLRDTYDHTSQILDIIESQKEISYSLMEVYLSAQNNKMSEVMKVLTVISSVFIPLTFIVGVYGMNFSRTDAQGKDLPLNMPELYSPYGYIGIVAIMILIAIVQIIYFRRKGWI